MQRLPGACTDCEASVSWARAGERAATAAGWVCAGGRGVAASAALAEVAGQEVAGRGMKCGAQVKAPEPKTTAAARSASVARLRGLAPTPRYASDALAQARAPAQPRGEHARRDGACTGAGRRGEAVSSAQGLDWGFRRTSGRAQLRAYLRMSSRVDALEEALREVAERWGRPAVVPSGAAVTTAGGNGAAQLASGAAQAREGAAAAASMAMPGELAWRAGMRR
eukprot:350008-Chlamydomonas_euryale.AAC.3